jgi:hypothetical protein
MQSLSVVHDAVVKIAVSQSVHQSMAMTKDYIEAGRVLVGAVVQAKRPWSAGITPQGGRSAGVAGPTGFPGLTLPFSFPYNKNGGAQVRPSK